MDSAIIRQAFDKTANECGGDIIQCCIDCGVEPAVERIGLIDYLSVHGGKHGKEVLRWCLDFPGTMLDLNEELDRLKVPRTWC